ncbi:MAG: outer membrane lipoprotein-sorting protein [Firmicutes bacterium]|jgi:outer membrane lipoprotein-sorting protein|nr:outer membrane lipoprotein-sorting protein [Bacillota bacterium]MDH7496547.1 outer membrane lipoprotein-sorting protein [Bacillota bacterium]
MMSVWGNMVKVRPRIRLLIPAVALVLLTAAMSGLSEAGDLTAKEIVSRMDANAYMASAHLVAKLVIRAGNREITKEMEGWVVGNEKAAVTFLNPGDRGTKYLKLGDELWMFFPDAEDLVKISGHMLRQGMMGSDFSYQDALESEKMGELYDFKVAGVEDYGGARCYVLEATALPGKQVSYPRRKIWVDSEKFVAVKEELYAASGRLLKVSRVEELRQKGGRTYASRVVMEDKLKRGSSTTFIIEKIEFDVDIPDDVFSLRSLMR